MMDDKLLAPCGIYCGICPIYIAGKENHTGMKEILASNLNTSANEIRCDGCFSAEPFVNCADCTVRNCIIERDIEGCFACNDFPCRTIEDMEDATGKKVILRSVPLLQKLGPANFIEEEQKHYLCPYCGYQLFMGAQRCRNCGNKVDLD